MRKIVLITLIAVTFSSAADLWWNTKKGKSLYNKGKYDKAQQQFDLAAASTPASQEGQFNRALNLARTGKIPEAKQILGGLKFDNPAKSAELAYTKAKISEMEGDAAMQQKEFGKAKEAYADALRQNVSALKQNPMNKNALKNAEIAGRKLATVPEDKNKDKNKQNQDQNKDQNKDQKKDDQNKKDDQKKDDPNKKDDQKKDDPNKDKDDKDKKDQPKPDPQKEDPAKADAAQLLDKYGDDGKDLKKPPMGKAQKAHGGKDW